MRNELPDILLAEDNPVDVYLVKEALRVHQLKVNLHVVSDGEAAIDYLEAAERGESQSAPVLAVLDVNLPRRTGIEVLAHLRGGATYGKIPVAMISSSRSAEAVADKIECFFCKPSDYDRFMDLGGVMKTLLAQSSTSPSPDETHQRHDRRLA